MAETNLLVACIAILLGFSLLTSMYLSWSIGTPYGMDFPLGKFFVHNGNYTVSKNFTDTNTSLQGIGEKDVWGKWAITDAKGLHPIELVNMDLIPFTSSYMARCTFGSVRNINNSWEESYYLKNINMAPTDATSIVIRYGTFTSSAFFPGSYEMLLVVEGSAVGIQEKNYVAGVDINGNYFYGFNLPAGATEGKLTYKAINEGSGWLDPINHEENNDYSIALYWNDTYMATVDHDNFQVVTGSDDMTRSADIRTNIGAPNTAYELQVKSHYEIVTVQHSAQQDVSGYDDASKFVIILGDVLMWGLPMETPIPSWMLMFFIGIPEFAILYIAVRLLRGGG